MLVGVGFVLFGVNMALRGRTQQAYNGANFKPAWASRLGEADCFTRVLR
jgi:hypothetical protein